MTSNYFCCGNPPTWNACGVGNPWDNVFGSEESSTPQTQKVNVDWNNPYGTQQYSTYDESRAEQGSVARSSRAPADVRSIGSGGTSSYGTSTQSSYGASAQSSVGTARYRAKKQSTSYLEGKSLVDMERERKAQRKALLLSETLMQTSESNLASLSHDEVNNATEAALAAKRGSIMMSQSVDEKATRVEKSYLSTMKTQKQIKMTETSRKKKELTPEDVRDPDTVPGMKNRSDITIEREAKLQSAIMISNGKYLHNANAGRIAVYNPRDLTFKRKGDPINPIV